MSKHKGLPCQHTVNKGHNHATLLLLFFFAYAHAKRVRQVSCEGVRTMPCACDHLIHCFPVEGHNCDILILNLVEFSNEEKWSLLTEPKQNSTIAQLSGIQHKIIRFFQSVFTRNQGNTRLSDMKYFENNLSGSKQYDMLRFAHNYSSVERL